VKKWPFLSVSKPAAGPPINGRLLRACAAVQQILSALDQLLSHEGISSVEVNTLCGPSSCTNLALPSAVDAPGSHAAGFNTEFSSLHSTM
jgi:hypothetical protein